jgi:hypothetical protein
MRTVTKHASYDQTSKFDLSYINLLIQNHVFMKDMFVILFHVCTTKDSTFKLDLTVLNTVS